VKNSLKQYFIQQKQLFGNQFFIKRKELKLDSFLYCRIVLGSKNAKIIFLKEFLPNNKYMNEESELLKKILNALNLSKEEISVLELSDKKQSNFTSFDSFHKLINLSSIIVLGLKAAQIVFKSDDNFYNLKNKYSKYKKANLIITYSLKDIMNDLSLKKHVWDDIKIIGN
jgi:hypothetical protein